MDETELPGSIGDLTLRPAQPTTPPQSTSLSALYEPNSKPSKVATPADMATLAEPTQPDQNLGYNGPNGPGGVSPAAPPDPASPLTSQQPTLTDRADILPAPLIPSQPMPPGAPAALAEAMNPTGAELSTLSTGLSTPAQHEPSDRARGGSAGSKRASPTPGLVDQARAMHLEETKRAGRAHPFKPATPSQIAEFATMWYDPAFSNDQLSRRYRTTERTLQRWREEFKLSDRFTAFKERAAADGIMGAAEAAINGLSQAASITSAMARAPGQAVSGQLMDKRFDPLQDEEIVALLGDIRSEVRMITAHSDLQVVQRKFMKLAALASTKMPTQSWPAFMVMIEGIQRSLLNARRIEADIPGNAADPVLLRKEAAGQMMRELKSVLTPEEQEVLAKIVKAGADRLMAKGGDSATITAGVDEATA